MLNVLVNASAKRLALFEAMQLQLAPEAPSIKPLCPTRWTVRHSALTSMESNIKPLLETLSSLSEENKSDISIKVRGLLKNMLTFDFVFSLKLAIRLFGPTDGSSRTLQKSTLNISAAMKSVDVIEKNCKSVS